MQGEPLGCTAPPKTQMGRRLFGVPAKPLCRSDAGEKVGDLVAELMGDFRKMSGDL